MSKHIPGESGYPNTSLVQEMPSTTSQCGVFQEIAFFIHQCEGTWWRLLTWYLTIEKSGHIQSSHDCHFEHPPTPSTAGVSLQVRVDATCTRTYVSMGLSTATYHCQPSPCSPTPFRPSSFHFFVCVCDISNCAYSTIASLLTKQHLHSNAFRIS